MMYISARTFSLLHKINFGLPLNFRSFSVQDKAPANSRSFEEDQKAARRWLGTFSPDTIPRRLCEIKFSRSSGPGGQNVNKVNSKATVRLYAKDFLPLVPSILHEGIRTSRYYAENSEALVIQADGSRKQSDNVDEAFRKLWDVIVAAGKISVKGETSPEQEAQVKKL